jgi:hypothetical protein
MIAGLMLTTEAMIAVALSDSFRNPHSAIRNLTVGMGM